MAGARQSPPPDEELALEDELLEDELLDDELVLEDELLDEELLDEEVSPPQPLTTARLVTSANANGILGVFTVAAPMADPGNGFHHKEALRVANTYGKSGCIDKKRAGNPARKV